jgi:hypothetical protein
MPKWTKQPKLTNNSLPLIAENKKITSQEFNELTGIVNDNFDLTVAPADQVYGKQGENFVAIPSGSGDLQTVLDAGAGASGIDGVSIQTLTSVGSYAGVLSLDNLGQIAVSKGALGVDYKKGTLTVSDISSGLSYNEDIGGGSLITVVTLDNTGIKFTDAVSGLGAYYAADYSAVGLLNDRWIPDYGSIKNNFVTLGTTQTITGLKTFPNTVGITDIVPKTIAVGGNGGLTIEHPQDDAGSFSIAILSINGSTRSYFEFKKTGLSAVMSMLNNASAPPSFDNSRGNLYVEAGALKYRGTSGTITTIANA